MQIKSYKKSNLSREQSLLLYKEKFIFLVEQFWQLKIIFNNAVTKMLDKNAFSFSYTLNFL